MQLSWKSRLAAVAMSAVAAGAAFGASAGVADATTKNTIDGHTIVLNADRMTIKGVPPLDNSPLSREAFISSHVLAAIKGYKKGDKIAARLEFGYQIGYPVSIAPGGVDVTAQTPSITTTAGVEAKLAPDIKISGEGQGGPTGGGGGGSLEVYIGEIGAQASASMTIPSQTLKFKVDTGKIVTVPIARMDLTQPIAEFSISGLELNATNAMGPMSARPYSKLTVQTPTGVYVIFDQGKTVNLWTGPLG